MSGKQSSGINVGGSSILVIFVLLCLTTFATLSMVSANADYKLTVQAAKASAEYYQADSNAEAVLAEIDSVLNASKYNSANEMAYLTEIIDGVAQIDGVTAMPVSQNSAIISYYAVVNEKQSILVELAIPSPPPAGTRYKCSTWKVINTAPLVIEDDSLSLFTGEIPK